MTGTWRAPGQGSAAPGLTLGQATAVLRAESFGCACIGHDWCCLYIGPQALNLQRGAHILVKMLDDLAKGK